MRRLIIMIFVLLTVRLDAQKINLLPDTIPLCTGDSATIEVRHEFGEQARIRWSTPGGPISNTRRIKAQQQGKYYITVSSSTGAASHSDSCFVKVLARPQRVMKDTAFCAGTELSLDAGNPGMRYMWSTGEKSRKVRVFNEGRYWVRVSNGKCLLLDTVSVKVLGVANPFSEKELVHCLNDPPKVLSIKPAADTRVSWSTGATGNSISVTGEGTYSVKVSHPRCADVRDSLRVKIKACDCEIIVPKSFTPNEDNRNDLFFPVLSCEYSHYNLSVTDRWGNTVFETNNAAAKWDGRYKGNLCPEDIYVYRIEAQEKSSRKKVVSEGYISLFR